MASSNGRNERFQLEAMARGNAQVDQRKTIAAFSIDQRLQDLNGLLRWSMVEMGRRQVVAQG